MPKSKSSLPPQPRTTTLVKELQLLTEGQRRAEERMGRVEEALAGLAEAQRRTEERLTTLAEAQYRNEERLGRVEEALTTLAEAQQRTEEQIVALAKDQQRTEQTVRNLAQAVGRLSDVIGFGLEDVARVVLPGYLERHLGIKLYGDELERRFIITDQQVAEVDLYGEGRQNGEKVVVIGECKSRIRSSQVEEFAETVKRLRPHVQDKLVPVMLGYWIHPSATVAAQKTGILLVASYQR
jgi:uncharacterized protein YhaN